MTSVYAVSFFHCKTFFVFFSHPRLFAYLEQYRQRLLTLETTPLIQYPSLSDYEPRTFQLKNSTV